MNGMYVDLQVNGGGGVLFNDAPSKQSIALMVQAHAQFGTGILFPTLITDCQEKIVAALGAVSAYIQDGGVGVGGIHLEGPFISKEQAGVHALDHIRSMTENDFELVTSLGTGRTIITVAPENIGTQMIRRLVDKGVVVSLGHSNATFKEALAAFDAGASMVTHLFNAMSQIQGREPGLVGAALTHPDVRCGIVADGYHVHYANIRMAFDLKGPEKLFLVTDAMSTVGTALDNFDLYGEKILVRNGRCTTRDGTLAGSTLDMQTAVNNCIEHLGLSREDATTMARPSL